MAQGKSLNSSLFRSSIGRKFLMALTGLMLIGFVIAHLLGNLQVFAGQEALNSYAHLLKSNPKLLWGARGGLILAFIIHVVTALQLRAANAAARPVPYAYNNTVQATLASRTMALSGVIILFYVIGHLLHFTLGIILPQYASLVDSQGRHDVYSMLVHGFQVRPVAIAYIFCLALLWSHLSHGISSVFQTLGFNHPRYTACVKRLGPGLSALIILGYISIPLAVMLGYVTLPVGGV